jgi:hypothetical protein
MSNNGVIPNFGVFSKLTEAEQRDTLLKLRVEHSNKDIQELWGFNNARFYKLVKDLDLPRKYGKQVNSDEEVSTELEGDKLKGSSPERPEDTGTTTNTDDVTLANNEAAAASAVEIETTEVSDSPSVLPSPLTKVVMQDTKADKATPVEKALELESTSDQDLDPTSGQVFDYVKVCSSEELSRKLKGVIALVNGDENNFTVSIHIEEIIPAVKPTKN